MTHIASLPSGSEGQHGSTQYVSRRAVCATSSIPPLLVRAGLAEGEGSNLRVNEGIRLRVGRLRLAARVAGRDSGRVRVAGSASGEWDTRPHLRPVGNDALAACAAAPERLARAANAVASLDGLADELGHAHPAQLLRVISLPCTSGGDQLPDSQTGWLITVRRASSAQSIAAAMDCARDGSPAVQVGYLLCRFVTICAASHFQCTRYWTMSRVAGFLFVCILFTYFFW